MLSFGTWRAAHVLTIWTEQLRTLAEELEQSEELAVRALKNLAVRALLRNLAVRALRVKHLACERASLPLIFWA